MGLVVKPAILPNIIHRRATFREVFRWRRGPKKETAMPVDLTGATGRAYLFADAKALEPLVTLTPDNPKQNILLGGTSGLITLLITPDITKDLPPHEETVRVIEIVWPDGDVCRAIQGRCPVVA